MFLFYHNMRYLSTPRSNTAIFGQFHPVAKKIVKKLTFFQKSGLQARSKVLQY